ncbi:MAG: pseudouridine-5'-phosphate glycosidase [Pseudomonadota bacterium]
MSANSSSIRYTPEVRAALDANRPVVALESTIITHGIPRPDNLEMARSVEGIIREGGAVPATIAVMDGRLQIGLNDEQLAQLAHTDGALKVSRADLAFAIAMQKTGGTTVAATKIAAHQAGINVFATGGIGGVHRGAEKHFDVSADLDELARTPVIVVCAGAKAILDLPKTLEVLETKGVPVVTYGADELPAFWSRNSGLQSPLRLDSAADIVRFHRTRNAMGLDGGMLIANPVPHDDEIPHTEMNQHIEAALSSATARGITGKAVTPFLLDQIFQITQGRSLTTNIALVKNNARLAAEIAVALASTT